MKKKIIIAMLFLILVPALATAGIYVREKGEWSEWWSLGVLDTRTMGVKRIYDKENRLVCWIVAKNYEYTAFTATSIDCEPSLELEHPLLVN